MHAEDKHEITQKRDIITEGQNSGKCLLNIDPDAFRENFIPKPFLIQHKLNEHPLFQLPRLIELSKKLPPENVEYCAGDIPINLDPKLTPENGLSIEETIRSIQDAGSWLVMKWVEHDPKYKALLDQCLDEMQVFSEKLAPGMMRREGFIFITSPHSVTPFHMDQEHNFLLQIHGPKTFHVFDRSVVSDAELEERFLGAHRNLVYKDAYQEKAYSFLLKPGMGLNVPVAAPHWLKNGNEVSISFSITFRSPRSERESFLYRVNGQLRNRGYNPFPVGKSSFRDSIKYKVFRMLRPIKTMLYGKEPQQSRKY